MLGSHYSLGCMNDVLSPTPSAAPDSSATNYFSRNRNTHNLDNSETNTPPDHPQFYNRVCWDLETCNQTSATQWNYTVIHSVYDGVRP